MPARRVFISSVIRDFEGERTAARKAVESLRLTPVMAEDFGAQPHSPQVACLEGVRTSDVYVGVFGARYGYIGTSGKSATEEEFEEARERGKPILCFVQEGNKDPDQEAFVRHLKQYETGYLAASFSTPADLALGVVKALNDRLGQPGVQVLDPAAAEAHIARHGWESPSDRQRVGLSEPWFGVVIVPERQGDPYLSILDLGDQHFREHLAQSALFGQSAIFRRSLGVQEREEADYLILEQKDDGQRQVVAALQVHTDGTLVHRLALGRRAPGDRLMSRLWVIDQDEVKRALVAFVAFADAYYGRLEQSPLIASLYLGTSLTGVAHKAFGRLPSVDPQQMMIPDHRLENPLLVPRPPLKLARAKLTEPAAIGQLITEHIARTFRVAQAYYTPPGA